MSRVQKGHVFLLYESETGRQSIALSDPSLECCVGQLKIFVTLCVSVNDEESSMSIDFGVTNAF